MNGLVAVTKPARDLVVAGSVDYSHRLFTCEMTVVAANVKLLISDYERDKAALCQHLAVAYLRITRGDLDVPWETWRERFVRRPNGKSYSPQLVAKWVQIGMQPDVRAAYEAWETKRREDHRAASGHAKDKTASDLVRTKLAKNRLEARVGHKLARALEGAAEENVLASPTSPAEIERQVGVLLAAWGTSLHEARLGFVERIGLTWPKRKRATP